MKKVSLVKCIDYEYEKVKYAISQSVNNLGGWDKYISKGDKVLLKVNLLMKKKPEEATTTHPVFVKALADLLVEYGALVVIGDSPGGPFNEKVLKGIYKFCGYDDISNDDTISLNYDVSSYEDTNPEGLLLKKLEVIGVLKSVDKVISVSKFKTHGMMVFTGAVKNMFGTIPGLVKAEYHYKMPNVDDFSNMLLDVCINADPVLSFMDGIVGMEGNGPSAGNPIDVGLVISSESPYHLDDIAVRIAGMDPYDVPTVKSSYERGLCEENLQGCELVGEELKDHILDEFKYPSIQDVKFFKNRVPLFLERILDYNLRPRPEFDEKKCIGCGECYRACPPDAITMKDNFPSVDLMKCIRCYCCQELCPVKAVEIYRPWILRKIVKM